MNSDKSSSDTDHGLYGKYRVEKNGEPVDECFVLEPVDDAAAREALETYADETENETLADDLRGWVGSLQPETDRAQMDPRVAGLLVVALGLAFIGVITVGAIVP